MLLYTWPGTETGDSSQQSYKQEFKDNFSKRKKTNIKTHQIVTSAQYNSQGADYKRMVLKAKLLLFSLSVVYITKNCLCFHSLNVKVVFFNNLFS